MNITLAFQDLDDLIIKNTSPPATPILRNKLSLLREQTEAYITEKEKVGALLAEAQAENAALKLALPKDESHDTIEFRGVVFKGISHGVDGVQLECAACGVALSKPPVITMAMYCHKCGFRASFNSMEIKSVLSKLPKQ